MIAVSVKTRTVEAGEHLQLLRSLAAELEKAMQAIAQNDIDALEKSVAHQQEISIRLCSMAECLREAGPAPLPSASDSIDPDLMAEIREANGELQDLNLRYSLLLKHSSRSIALMASLFSSYRGEFQEAPGIRLKQQTWSCQV